MKTVQQKSGLRLKTKPPVTFTNKKKKINKQKCRKKINVKTIEKE